MRPWAKYVVNARENHYADFEAWEKWMSEAVGDGAFMPVWDGMDVAERIDLYALMGDVAADIPVVQVSEN